MLVWLTALALAADPAVVTVDGALWADLQARAAEARRPRVAVVPEPWIARREVVVATAGERTRVTWTWTWVGVAPTVVDVPVPAGIEITSVRLDGAAWGPDPARPAWIRVPVLGRATLQVVGAFDGSVEAPVSLDLGPGSGRVVVPAGVVVVGQDRPAVRVRDGWSTSGSSVLLAPAPPPADDRGRALSTGRVDVGLTVRDADTVVVADVAWLVRRGRVSTVRVEVPGAGADLTVDGPVASWSRAGDTVTVELDAPASARVPLRLRWTLARHTGVAVQLPQVTPLDVVSVERRMVVARDTDEEVVPRVSGGTTLFGDALAELGALVSGTPSVARSGDVRGSVDVFSFVPVERPPLVVDVADWFVAATSEGRALIQGTLSVRNERAAALTVHVPDGMRVLAVQVDGVPVTVASAGDGRWRVALPRSVETMRGLLAFPVEITALATHEGTWVDEGAVRVRLPAVDADVAVRHVTLELPRDARIASELGEHGRVEDFSEGEGLAYGFGEGVDQSRASALYQEALGAWMDNDFESAQARLDDLRDLGAENANVGRLQSNLDMVGGVLVDGDEALERRLKDQARSRALDVEREQADVLRYADEQAAAGNVAEATEAYAAAERTTRVLEALEQDESEAQVRVAAEVKAKKEAVTRQAEARSATFGGFGSGGGAGAARPRGADAPSYLSPEAPEEAVAWADREDDDADWRGEGEPAAPPAGPAPKPAPPADPVTGTFSGNFNFDGAVVTTPTVDAESSARVPVGRSYRDAVEITSREGVRPGEPAPVVEATVAALAVSGTSASVVVPRTGETIRFQHLLIPPGTDVPVLFRVDLPRRPR